MQIIVKGPATLYGLIARIVTTWLELLQFALVFGFCVHVI